MEVPIDKAELLQEAFTRFNSVSLDLERSYKLLKKKVQSLNIELTVKNQALVKTHQEKKALQEELERDRRLSAVGEMSIRMAHELRNPLGSIELFSSLVEKEVEDMPKLKEWTAHLKTAVRAMDHALSNLLLFTRKPNAHLRKTNLDHIIQEAIHFALPKLQQNHIRIIQSLKPINKSFQCDEDLMRQIIVNLIQNAIDAMPEGGELSISTSCSPSQRKGPEWAILTIGDTGHGISKRILPKVFDPFFSTKKKGTGLGLAIVYNAVQAHNGIIKIKTEGHTGTRFILKFPVSKKQGKGLKLVDPNGK